MKKHVYTQQVAGKKVIVIEAPRADRHDKPVYINNDLLGGTFRRNAEGDYRCSPQSVKAMLRDQSDLPMDSTVINELSWKDLDADTIVRYRNRFSSLKPAHIWNGLDTLEFLKKAGAVRKNEEGVFCPTVAGLVMFGTEDVITQIFPDYFLDYREKYDSNRWSDRVVSNLGEWSGNIVDFFFKITDKLCADVKRPFKMRNYLEREDDTSVHKAIREALANAVIHADYYGRQGIVIEKSKNEIKIANPGSCRPDISEVKEGGVSDPRNPNIFKLFAMIDIGERAGSGVFNICSVWNEMEWKEPTLLEKFNPERTIVVLPIELEEQNGGKGSEKEADSEKSSEKSSEKNADIGESSEKKTDFKKSSEKSSEKEMNLAKSSEKSSEKIMNLIKDNPKITIEEISCLLNITTRAVEKNLIKLKTKGLIERFGSRKIGYWKI